MADRLTFNSQLSISTDGGVEVVTLGQLNQGRDLATIAESTRGINTLSQSWQAISFGAIDDTERSWVCLNNLALNAGEDITIGKEAVPQVGSGSSFTLDGTPTQAGASVPNTLTGAGYFRKIISAGTSQSIAWQIGDIAVYLGSSGVWGRIPPTEFLKIRVGDNVAVPLVQDGKPILANAATGTPRLSNIAAGALA